MVEFTCGYCQEVFDESHRLLREIKLFLEETDENSDALNASYQEKLSELCKKIDEVLEK